MPRLDRFLTLYVFSPISKMFGSRESHGIPILMYHRIPEERAACLHPDYWIHTSPRRFDLQMRFLHENGHRVVPLRELDRCLENRTPGEKAPVVLTFDDGYRNFFTAAFPVLNRFGFGATVFLPTDKIQSDAERGDHLTWEQVRELHSQGVEFGSHTVTHRTLWTLPLSEIEQEIRASKSAIEDRLGSFVESFSYPYAFPQGDTGITTTLTDLLRKNGYRYAVTTIIGRAFPGEDRFTLKRIPVNDGDEETIFSAKLEGNYDWLQRFQYANRKMKRWF